MSHPLTLEQERASLIYLPNSSLVKCSSLACKNQHSPTGQQPQLERLSQVPWFLSPCTIVLFTLLFSTEIPLVYLNFKNPIYLPLMCAKTSYSWDLAKRKLEQVSAFPPWSCPEYILLEEAVSPMLRQCTHLCLRVPSFGNRHVAIFPSRDEKGSYNGPCNPTETGDKSNWETIPSCLHASPFKKKKFKVAQKKLIELAIWRWMRKNGKLRDLDLLNWEWKKIERNLMVSNFTFPISFFPFFTGSLWFQLPCQGHQQPLHC